MVLAVGRFLSVPLPWLERKIEQAPDKVKQRELLTTYLLTVDQATGKEKDQGQVFLHGLAKRALTGNTTSALELAEVFDRALTQVRRYDPGLFDDGTYRLSMDIVTMFSQCPERIPRPCILLAVNVTGFCNHPEIPTELKQALEAALLLNKKVKQNPDSLSHAIANRLAEKSPKELLLYPPTCEPVQSALRMSALQCGWMVFKNRILDSEGVEIANANATARPEIDLTKPAGIKQLIDQLPPRTRDVLDSYWLGVAPGGPCQPGDSLRTVYDALQERVAGEIDDDLTKGLDRLFPDGLVSFNNWRRTLARIEARFADNPDARAVLRSLGLCKRLRDK